MKAPVMPCKCGTQPVLCYSDHIRSFNGTNGPSVYETFRFYRYICPVCHEWGYTSEFPAVAKRFWNKQMKGAWKPYWHNADMEKGEIWRTENGNILIGSKSNKPISANFF